MSSVSSSHPTQRRKFAMPDTLVIIFFVAIFTSLLTWLIPAGQFDTQKIHYQVEGVEKSR